MPGRLTITVTVPRWRLMAVRAVVWAYCLAIRVTRHHATGREIDAVRNAAGRFLSAGMRFNGRRRQRVRFRCA